MSTPACHRMPTGCNNIKLMTRLTIIYCRNRNITLPSNQPFGNHVTWCHMITPYILQYTENDNNDTQVGIRWDLFVFLLGLTSLVGMYSPWLKRWQEMSGQSSTHFGLHCVGVHHGPSGCWEKTPGQITALWSAKSRTRTWTEHESCCNLRFPCC